MKLHKIFCVVPKQQAYLRGDSASCFWKNYSTEGSFFGERDRMQKSSFSNGIFIAGFGRKCRDSRSQRSFPAIQHVWDSDSTKQGKGFHGWEIEHPFAGGMSSDGYCIIAVSRYAPIVRRLGQSGYRKDSDFQRSQSFLAFLRSAMVDEVGSILLGAAAGNMLGLSVEDVEEASRALDAFSGQAIYRGIETSALDPSTKAALEDLLLGHVMKGWIKGGMSREGFVEIRKMYPLSGIVSGLAMVLDRHVDKLCAFLERGRLLQKADKAVHTIGIYDLRYSNGGGQKVLSLLLPLYVSLGYRVILITENLDEQEYPVPPGVVRVVLKHRCLGVMQLRLEEFFHYIQKYRIDIMCLHYIEQDIRFFYDTLFFKLLGIPVLAEIHIMFLSLVRKRNYMAEQWAHIFRLMDQVIVLSKSNELFWKNLGCKATYIPNPVEQGQQLWNRPISFAERNGKKILWIGRTTDTGKRLLDVVDIMAIVRDAIPDAKLCIVGEAENLSRLRQLIADKHLEKNIEFAGYHTDVTPFYENSDVMLMTSEMESFSMVLVESKLHGVPTVMYELPYLELVRDMRGILAVPQQDKTAAAQALISVLEDKKLRHRMSIDAKRSIHRFVIYDIKMAWCKVFDEISHMNDGCSYDSDQRIIQELLLQEVWAEEG